MSGCEKGTSRSSASVLRPRILCGLSLRPDLYRGNCWQAKQRDSCGFSSFNNLGCCCNCASSLHDNATGTWDWLVAQMLDCSWKGRKIKVLTRPKEPAQK